MQWWNDWDYISEITMNGIIYAKRLINEKNIFY